ncbi:DNA polymerase III subunit chi [Pseudomonas sp. CC6-YY-74]|uniref:DNA polymerase III subunit chi n=1 Tax=Pseudomonas sp. CC6-YY-74 TaxID=1930532 RepID=UPI0009A25884|nr:DNA polymerase III subunit chi [Pseudomonas sp. CC6-YY-74]
MDTPKPPQKPTHLLDDLESIRQLLGDENLDPPLLTDTIDPDSIPLLSDIVTPPPAPVAEPAPQPQAATLHSSIEQTFSRDSDMNRLDNELRAAAELILQDVIDDFVPQIEAELKRRLQARLSRLLPPRK